MVDRRHLENAFLAQLVGTNLQDHRERFDDKNPSDKGQQQFLLDHDSYGADCAAQRQRTDIAHEHFRWMRVVPEKSNRGTDHGSAENGELTNLRHALQFEVGRKRGVPAEVGENRERSGRDHRTADCESVEAVGKIYGVARSNNHNHNKDHERQEGQRPEVGMNRQSLDHQVRVELLEERYQQSGGVFSAMLQNDQRDRNQDAGGGLIAQLGARGKSEITVMNDFEVVIGKTDCTERNRGKHGDPHKRIAEVRPEQRRHQDGDRDQQSAHGRRARFFLMSLRTFFAYVLPNLEIAQALNHDRPDDQAGEKSGEAGKGSAERQVTKNTERRKIVEELQVEQPVEQSASDTSSRFSVLSLTPVYLCVPCGSGFSSPPQRTQRNTG